MSRERRIVNYRGRVQGVGFRYTTQSTARGFEVRGYVRNLDNGDVELVVEGADQELDRFLAAVRERMQDFIRGETVTQLPPTDEFASFEIRT